MASMNVCLLVGRLGKDPELRMTTTGKQVCNFSVATDNGWGENKRTVWHHIVVWGNQAAACSTYLRKGSQVAIQGEIDNKSYVSNGETKWKTEIVAREVTFLDKASDRPESGQGSHQQAGGYQQPPAEVDDCDVPF